VNKKALFLSVAIATFVLACLGGVFSVYKAFASSSVPVATVQTVSQVAITASAPLAVAPTSQKVTPEEAASIASAYLGFKDVYAVENAVINSVAVYKVIFSSGDIVYVGLDGRILQVERPNQTYTDAGSQPSIIQLITDHDNYEHESDND
jgi:hypothetical protein